MSTEKAKQKPSNGRTTRKRDASGRFKATKRGKARTYTQAEVDAMFAANKDKPAPKADELPAIALPIKRTQHCLKHDTMKINGKCRRCEWEKNPKRKAKTTPRIDNSRNNIARKDTGQTIGIGGSDE